MLGFETIGNATVIVHDGGPVIATDPWLGEPAYFGSWGLPYEIPEEQRNAIFEAKYIWVSHGHPDHLNPDAIQKLHGRKILLPDHVGHRIRDDLLRRDFDVSVLPNGRWVKLSDHVQVLCISDYFQDAVLLINVDGVLLINLNDATDRGWGREVKRISRKFERSFLLKLFGYGDVDMMHFVDDAGQRITPQSVRKRPIGEQVSFFANLYGVTDIVPFSCFHRYQRSDSVWANDHTTPINAFYEQFNETKILLHPPFIHFDAETEQIRELKPALCDLRVLQPSEFGDSWSEPLKDNDAEKLKQYFQKIEGLQASIDFVRIAVGGDETMIDIAGAKTGRGIGFEAPRNSLMTAIEHEIFDDLLIGNFMKTQLHGNWDSLSLHPQFTPYVAKYADNGRAKTRKELREYFREYRKRAPIAYLTHVFERESERRMRRLVGVDTATFRLAKKTYLFLKRA